MKLIEKVISRKKIFMFVVVGAFVLGVMFFMYSFWQISGAIINQDLNLDIEDLDIEYNESLDEAFWDEIPYFGFENETYFEEGIFTSSYYLKNEGDFNAGFKLEATCNTLNENYGCGYVDWWYEYKLFATNNKSRENKIIILASDAGIEKFSDFEIMSWEVFMNNGSFPYVNIFLEDEKGEMVLSINGNYQVKNSTNNMIDKTWVNTFEGFGCSTNCFTDLTSINNETLVLIKKSYDANVSFESLKKYKEKYGNSRVLRFEININNQTKDSESRVRKIMINNNQYEVSGLEAGKQLDFDFKVRFPERVYTDEYTITTQVLPR